jgi:hypothetical protein
MDYHLLKKKKKLWPLCLSGVNCVALAAVDTECGQRKEISINTF